MNERIRLLRNVNGVGESVEFYLIDDRYLEICSKSGETTLISLALYEDVLESAKRIVNKYLPEVHQ